MKRQPKFFPRRGHCRTSELRRFHQRARFTEVVIPQLRYTVSRGRGTKRDRWPYFEPIVDRCIEQLRRW